MGNADAKAHDDVGPQYRALVMAAKTRPSTRHNPNPMDA